MREQEEEEEEEETESAHTQKIVINGRYIRVHILSAQLHFALPGHYCIDHSYCIISVLLHRASTNALYCVQGCVEHIAVLHGSKTKTYQTITNKEVRKERERGRREGDVGREGEIEEERENKPVRYPKSV